MLLPFAFALPLLFWPFLFFSGRRARSLTVTLLAVSTLLVIPYFGIDTVFPLGRLPFFGITAGLEVTPLSLSLSLLSLLIGALAALSSRLRDPAFFSLFLLFVGSMVGLFFSPNLLQFYLFWELMVIPSFFIIWRWGEGDSRRIAANYFVAMHVCALLLLVGIAVMRGEGLALTFASLQHASDPGLLSLLFALAFSIKMGLFPFHGWLPDAHSMAPTPVSALLSGAMVACGGYGLLRIFSYLPLPSWLGWLGALSMLYGGVLALGAEDVKRFLAYSTISQMGYVAFGVGGGAAKAAGWHLMSHAAAKALLFLAAGVAVHSLSSRELDSLKGAAAKLPLTSFFFSIGALSLVGVPPLSGFFSERLLFLSVDVPSSLLFLGGCGALLTAVYTFSVLRLMISGRGVRMGEKRGELFPLFALSLLVLSLSLFPTGVL